MNCLPLAGASEGIVFGHLFRKVTLGVVILYSCWPSPGQTNALQHIPPSRPRVPHPEVSAFLPVRAMLIKELTVDFKLEAGPTMVLAYAIPEKPYPPFVRCGVRVLKYNTASGWAVAFEETDSVDNGGGASDAISVEKVISSSGKEGLVVILKFSGAGTAEEWHVLAAVGNKFVKLNPTPIRDKALKARNYMSGMGYNNVTSEGDLVIEELPGYSPGRARCCPDRPSVAVAFRFTGSSLKLDSVKELPFTPP